MPAAYAVRLIPENFGAIKSESPEFDLAYTEQWLSEHGSGYFVRDEDSPWDCAYLADVVFEEIYAFKDSDDNAIFRRVSRE